MTGTAPGRARVRIGCDHARAWLDGHTAALAAEQVAVADAAQRVLQREIIAAHDLPPAARAAADGYALHGGATAGASEYNPLPLRIRAADDDQPLRIDQAAEIVSGDPLPAGADTVLGLEEGERRGALLELFRAVPVGQHVLRAGEDVARGQCVLAAGQVLRPADLGLLVALGLAQVEVHRRPRVLLLLATASAPDGNGVMLHALLHRDGAGAVETRHTPTAAALGQALRDADADLLLVCGGSGEGGNDFAAAVIAEQGELAVHGIAMNPGETTGLGRVGGVPLVLLPGTPLACLYAYEWFAGRAVRRLAGGSGAWPYGQRRLQLTQKVASTLGRLEFCRVQVEGDSARPLAIAEHRLLSSAVRADGFVPVPEASEGWPQGAEVTVWMQPRSEAGEP